ncbi:MAG: hypothetical protein IKV77_09960, partial [Alistipes sp.]|nr:hypothetical protein [Alistipes sp.]
PVLQAGEFAETGEYDIIFIDLLGSMDVSGVLQTIFNVGLCCVTTMICQWQSIFGSIAILLPYFLYTLMLLFTPIFMYVCIKVNHIAMLIILIRFIPKQLALRGHYRIE